MKYVFATVLHLLFLSGIFAQNTSNISTTDIDNFWAAYDKFITIQDNAEQLDYLKKLFVEIRPIKWNHA